jgi:hypothetical protein
MRLMFLCGTEDGVLWEFGGLASIPGQGREESARERADCKGPRNAHGNALEEVPSGIDSIRGWFLVHLYRPLQML